MDSVKPLQILTHEIGVLTDTLGKVETEAVAALIVRWHVVNNHAEWMPVSRRDIADLLPVDDIAKGWARNPFWKPSPYDFCNQGFIEGWNDGPDAKDTLTAKFHEALSVRAAKDRERRQRVLIDPRAEETPDAKG